MQLFQEKQGVKKAKFWLSVLMLFLCIAAGLQLGNWIMTQIPAEIAALPFSEAISHLWRALKDKIGGGNQPPWPIVTVEIVSIAVMLFLVHKFLPKRRERQEDTEKDKFLDSLFFPSLLAGVVAGMFLNDFFLQLLSAEMGILSISVVVWLILVLQDVNNNNNSTDYTYFEKHKRTVLQITTLTGMAFLGLPVWIPNFWGFTLPQIPLEPDLLGYYTALLSLTFISISVMGVLSDRSVVIYWDNVSEGVLIRPVFGSFAAYTYYSIGATLGAGICVALNNSTAFILFGIANIVTLILLTFTMVAVYYDREGKKEKLKAELENAFNCYQWTCKYENSDDAEKEKLLNEPTPWTDDANDKVTKIENNRIGYDNYEEYMMRLCQYVCRAYDEHDLTYLQEVYYLYVNNSSLFQTPSGKRVISLLCSNCNAETWPLLIRSIRELLDQLRDHPVREKDPLTDKCLEPGHPWNRDESLWRALANAEYLPQWLQQADNDPLDGQELQDFMHLVARRLVILYNDAVTHCNLTVNKDSKAFDYLKVAFQDQQLSIQTEDGRIPDPKQLKNVLKNCFGVLLVETTFPARLAQVLSVMLNNLNRDAICLLQTYFKGFPLLEILSPYLSMFGIPDELQTGWKTHFPAKKED